MRRLVASAAIACVLAACGGGEVALGPSDRTDLHRRVNQVRTAAGSHDPSAAHFVLTSLEQRVRELLRQGQISATQGQEILAAAASADAEVDLVPTTTTTLPPAPKGKGKHGKD